MIKDNQYYYYKPRDFNDLKFTIKKFCRITKLFMHSDDFLSGKFNGCTSSEKLYLLFRKDPKRNMPDIVVDALMPSDISLVKILSDRKYNRRITKIKIKI